MDENKIIEWLTSMAGLNVIALLGMLMHFFKQKITGETLADIKVWFASNFKSTVVAFVSTVVISIATYLTLATGQPIDLLTFFGIGYMCDSAFNKWEK